MLTQLLTEQVAVPVDGIHAASLTAGSYDTTAIDMGSFRQVAFLIDTGTLGASATVDFQLTGCATSGGSFTAISGTSITQATASSKYVVVSITSDKLTSLGLGYRYIKGHLTIGTATSVCAVAVIASDAHFEPTSGLNAASVLQVLQLYV